MKTYKEAVKAGYKERDQKWTRGYISRKNFSLDDAPLHVAGGRRKGELYVMVPSWRSSTYCHRVYLAL